MEKFKKTLPLCNRWIWLHPPSPASNIGKTPTCHTQRKMTKRKVWDVAWPYMGVTGMGMGGASPSFSNLFHFTAFMNLMTHFSWNTTAYPQFLFSSGFDGPFVCLFSFSPGPAYMFVSNIILMFLVHLHICAVFFTLVLRRRGIIVQIEYQSVCPIVGIGAASPRKRVYLILHALLDPKAGDNTRLRVRAWRDPIPTKAQTLWYSVYSVPWELACIYISVSYLSVCWSLTCISVSLSSSLHV